jgi:hypothetical protein
MEKNLMTSKKSLTKQEIQGIQDICQTAADYLQHPAIAEIAARFSLPGSNVVRGLREVVARLKTV